MALIVFANAVLVVPLAFEGGLWEVASIGVIQWACLIPAVKSLRQYKEWEMFSRGVWVGGLIATLLDLVLAKIIWNIGHARWP